MIGTCDFTSKFSIKSVCCKLVGSMKMETRWVWGVGCLNDNYKTSGTVLVVNARIGCKVMLFFLNHCKFKWLWNEAVAKWGLPEQKSGGYIVTSWCMFHNAGIMLDGAALETTNITGSKIKSRKECPCIISIKGLQNITNKGSDTTSVLWNIKI